MGVAEAGRKPVGGRIDGPVGPCQRVRAAVERAGGMGAIDQAVGRFERALARLEQAVAAWAARREAALESGDAAQGLAELRASFAAEAERLRDENARLREALAQACAVLEEGAEALERLAGES